MGAWGIKALERDEGLDVLDILKNEYVPEHPVMDLGEMIELMKEEVMLGSDFSQIDFLFDNTAMALAELYFQWKDNSKLDYDHEEAIWDKVTGFTASKEALAFLLRQLTDIKNEVPDEDGIREIVDLWKNEDSGEIAPAWLEHLNQLIDRLDSEQEARQMYIKKYWGNFIGGSDDSLNLVAFLVDQKKEEIPLSEIFAKIGLDKQNWDFHQTVEYLEFTHSDGVEMDFHFAIDVVTDLAAILLECSVSGSVNLQDLDEYNTPARRIRITVTPEEHDAMNKALADFAQNPLEYDLSEMMDNEEIQEMARDVEALRKELYEAAGRNRDYYVKAEDMKNLLPDWEGADGCIATNRITMEGYKVGYCYRENPDGGWDSGWRFTAGDESEAYMDDPNNAGIYKLNTICNDDPDIISLLNTPAPCAFERDENGVFQQIKDWKPDEDEEDPDMDILKQCQKWHEESKQHKIIDALEAIPAEERTPEMDSELARAYNNLADPHKPTCKEMLKKALALLKPHEEYFEDDYYWNFRMGYSYFYLDQEGRALRYFEKALEVRPGDDDTKEFIDRCKQGISLPQFWECFRDRTENWWETFAEMEAELRQMMDDDKDHTRGAELVAQMEETLNLAFDEISFEMGFNGEKYELILTPEGDKVKLFELVYFQKHAPKEVLEHWNILVGRQPLQNIGLRTEDGWDISGDDVQIWLEEQGENSFALSAYCEKLLPMLREAEGRVWWMLTTLTDQVLGEIPHMRYIDSFDVLEEPRAEPSILMSQLPDALKERGLELSTDPEAYLESYLGYEMKPNEDPDADWRLDVMAGSTCCVPLINGYLNADNDFMDDLHADGAVAGFFCYPLDTLREKEGTQKIFDFRDKLEELFTTGDGPEVLTLTGGATGLYCGYVDFIAWDIQTALQMAKNFFEDSDIPWASFHTFRREAGTVNLKTPSEEEPDDEDQAPELDETLAGMDYIPYTPQNEEEYFQQLEQWNDEDEYTRCIQALNAIPEDWRNYRIAYAMARALENYAIIGDHDEGTPNYKGDKALRRAIEVLESVREEGQDKAEWNMRMAYGYQYLYGQEEQAIPYAQRWAELDPEDKDAPAVIQECQKEIAKRAEAEAEDESDHTGVFTGFVLLSKGEWDKEQFIRDMKEKWDIAVDEYDASEEKDDDALVFEVGDMVAAVSLATYPIPNGEAELNAENNYMWEDAVKVAKEHCAHIMVAVLGKEENLLEKGKLYTKVVAACCRQEYATGIYTSGVVFEPRFYEGFADMMQDGELPIFNWIWFGLWRNENGMNGYTYGMDVFGKDEMEVLGTDAKPSDLRDFLASLVSYVLENDVELHDGETIGFAADDKHTITRSPGVGLPEEQMTLKISWESSDGDPDDDGDDPDGEMPEDEEAGVPEVYTEEEMEAVEGHIQQYFGKVENVFHELVSPDIHVDICMVPPTEERDYCTLVTMGMGAHRMNVPEELVEYKLERAELAIALPADWKLDQESMKDEKWYWPIRLLKSLARLPINCDSWLGHGHTVENREPFADNTKLCTATLIGPQDTEDGSEVCTLPGGEEVNFYQVIPLYEDELDYKLEHDTDALLNKMRGISFVVNPTRQDAITRGTLSNDDFDGEMDDASYHIESIEEKELPIDPINAYNHMAIYLRWCMEHDLMGEEFLAEYGEVVEKVKADSASVDLREFIRDELDGCLFSVLFNHQGRAFAGYYYGEGDSPYYPADVDDNALCFFGPERYHSDEFQDEAYLFIPFDEDYYQAMAEVIEERFANWQGQDFDEDTLEPSEVAQAIMEYLDCECTYFPSMADDDPIMSAYSYAQRLGVREGFVPVLIQADDETLLECLVMNADPKNDVDIYEFDLKAVTEYRKKMLSTPVKDGKTVLEELTGQRKEEAEDDDMDWDEEVLGEMEGGEPNDRFSSYWDDDTEMTYPLILAKIPVKNPWEIFAYLPFGNWNDCPDTPELMAAAKYWFQQHGAIPAAMSHDELEFELPTPISKERAMEVAVEQYGFCPDLDQNEDGSIGSLADVLWQSTVWYFWWD
ncbi:immunity protein Imm33 domain-containing protein [Flavonifractor plautii]|uniref:immunity protein Imm33 domain-containing protein n=1 Tax=Flavonifractor plautii TaxID=292800 RepID=UPI0032BFEAB0